MSDPEIQGLDTLETPERVDLQVDLAGVGSRVLSFILDSVLLAAVIMGTSFVLFFSGFLFGVWAVVLWLLAIFLLWWFYFAAFEGSWHGQTPGKRILGLRVQKVGGYPIGWPEALIRNFLRPLVDLFMMSVPVGLLVMLFTRRHQRIGDLAAGTVVVRERTGEIADLSDLGYASVPARASVQTGGPELTVEEFELLHEFLSRQDHFDAESRRRIGQSLAAALRERLAARGRLSESLRQLEDEPFLRQVDAEYRGSQGASV